MARKKTEEAPAGAPAWMATFSDLMNLLLCFFVLLFSMSTVDAEKFEMVIASLQSSFSILPSGGASIGDGEMVSSGVSQLQMYDIYYNQMANTQTTDDTSESSDVAEEYKEEALAESEQMAEQVQDLVAQYGIQDQVEIDFNAEYVLLNLNGAVLFDSGKSEIKSEAYPLMDKIGKILQSYQQNMIEIEGHTDNIPFTHSSNMKITMCCQCTGHYMWQIICAISQRSIRHISNHPEEANTFRLQIIPHRREGRATDVLR